MPAGRPKLCRCATPTWYETLSGVFRCAKCNGAPGTARVAEARAAIEEQRAVAMKEEDVKVTATTKPLDEGEPSVTTWSPDKDDFILLKGKAYLPARRRIQWMRAEHPDWTITTEILHFDKATRVGTKVTGGLAVVKATVADNVGAWPRIIAQGTKTEYSENFPDFLEKAETGAIARALAVAGYGTEMAMDLDEGLDKERIADAPVDMTISIGPSTAPGIGKGGRSANATVVQVKRIGELSSTLGLGVEGLSDLIASLGYPIDLPAYGMDDEGQAMRTWLFEQTSDTAAEIINVLSVGMKE